MTQARGRRARRGSAAAGFATFVALTSHVIGGGALPTLMGVLVPLVLSTLVCVLLAGRRLSLPRLSLSVVASQSLFHLLFSVFTPMAGAAGPTNAVERHAMHHGGAASMPGSMAGAHGAMSGMSGSMSSSGADAMAAHSHTSPAMLAAHLVAAVLTIAMIYWSEVLPERIGSFVRLVVRALLPSPVRPIPVPSRPMRHLGVVDVLPRHLGVLRSPVLTRGPPVTAF
ncbi:MULTISPECIES: hypothetical protein [unclassified Brevibacterium]|uniref:hypothetical protein n=1 Tax=unclassified Brevibacterium TaxID=2614124 RepID=UPI001E55BE94|nr:MULTISPECIES: hypothetical protein [unclassified Brevibacterium]MDK8433450.1 hypothetical protein [Brevibacterium sp. H-BE7]